MQYPKILLMIHKIDISQDFCNIGKRPCLNKLRHFLAKMSLHMLSNLKEPAAVIVKHFPSGADKIVGILILAV